MKTMRAVLRAAWRGGSFSSVAAMLALMVSLSASAVTIYIGPPPEKHHPAVRASLNMLAEKFMSSHPDITVVVSPDNPDFSAYEAVADELGDVLILPGSPYGRKALLSLYAEQGYVIPLDNRVEEPRFGKADFYANLWSLTTYSGKTWGVPLLVRCWGVGVDTSRVDPKVVEAQLGSWDGFVSLLSDFAIDQDGDGVADASLVNTNMSADTMWTALFLSKGGNPNVAEHFAPASAPWQAATSVLEEVVSRNAHAVWRGGLPPSAASRYEPPVQFVHDDTTGVGSLPRLRAKEGEWKLLPAPGNGPIPPLDTTVLAIKRSTPEREAAAWEFVLWLSSAETMSTFYPARHLTPLRRSVVESSADPDVRVFASQLERMKFQRPQLYDSPHWPALRAIALAMRTP